MLIVVVGGGGEDEEKSAMVYLSRHWRVNRRQGHGWSRHARKCYLPPFPFRPFALFPFFLTKSKEPTGCRKLWEQKAYVRRFAFVITYPANKVPVGFEGLCIQRSPNMLTRISARDSRFLLLNCHICIKRSLCSNHILIITLKNINVLLHLVVTYCVNFVYWCSW